ncbi:MAG: hypothetical protein H5T69_00275 [Chloroflexi bacterium]|nr:hypothetical protein [Chloroflexota bacterium]
MSDFDTLSRNQRRFVRALVTARSVREAAGMARISEPTAWRWLRLEVVRRALRETQDALLGEATRHAAGLLSEALDTLADIMRCGYNSPSSRVAAAKAILECGLRYAELVGLAERVARLEESLGGSDAQK